MSDRYEPLEDKQFARYFINPDPNNPIFKSYKKHQASFWVEEEVDSELKKDSVQFPELDPKIRYLIKYQIAFFLIADGWVNESIAINLDSRITDREVQVWYNYQKMMEDIHNITYVKLADTYITDSVERKRIDDAIITFPAVGKKIAWAKKWLGSNNDLHRLEDETIKQIRQLKAFYQSIHRSFSVFSDPNPPEFASLFKRIDEEKPLLGNQILVNLFVEGVSFQVNFATIFWISHQYHKLPGLTKVNEFISRDEGMHADFGINLYKSKIKNKLSQEEIAEMFNEALEIEYEFILESLPNDLLNMNSQLMYQYAKFVADRLLVELGYEKIFHTTNPFPFMNKQSISVRISDFFIDGNVSEYGHHASGTKIEDQSLNFSEDF